MKCMLLYLEVMGGVEEVHCFKMPPPIRPYFFHVSSLYFIKGWEKALTLIKSCIHVVPDIRGEMFVLI